MTNSLTARYEINGKFHQFGVSRWPLLQHQKQNYWPVWHQTSSTLNKTIQRLILLSYVPLLLRQVMLNVKTSLRTCKIPQRVFMINLAPRLRIASWFMHKQQDWWLICPHKGYSSTKPWDLSFIRLRTKMLFSWYYKFYYTVKVTAEKGTAALTSLVSERPPVDWARYNYKKIGVGVMLIE